MYFSWDSSFKFFSLFPVIYFVSLSCNYFAYFFFISYAVYCSCWRHFLHLTLSPVCPFIFLPQELFLIFGIAWDYYLYGPCYCLCCLNTFVCHSCRGNDYFLLTSTQYLTFLRGTQCVYIVTIYSVEGPGVLLILTCCRSFIKSYLLIQHYWTC